MVISAVRRSVLGGLSFPQGVMQFEFKPSIGIIAKDIDKLAIDIRSFRVPLEKSIREVMMPSIMKNFIEGGRPDAWEPLTDATWEKRAKDGYEGGSTLVKTGNLSEVASSFKIWKIGKTSAAVTNLPGAEYGGYHQAGYGKKPESLGQIAKRTGLSIREVFQDILAKQQHAMTTGSPIRSTWQPWAPARPFIVMQAEDEDAIAKIFEDWMVERAIRVGKFGVV